MAATGSCASSAGAGWRSCTSRARSDLDRLVALKELAAFHAADPDFARRFVRESRLAGSLVHPNVITVFDYFEHAGMPYIAMEYLERGSLRPHVGRMTLAQIGGVLEGLLAGLAAAEQLGIVHRDLKPENLMVTAAGGVKIADFGIAKATLSADTGAFVTATGTTIGTPPYMAPEQAMAKDIGSWTDLYSVGCIAYELFTGSPPFVDAEEPMAIMLRHVTEPLPPAAEVADVDPAISAWIERLVAKKPEDRPQSATAAWEDLEEILIGELGPRWRREAPLPVLVNPRVPGPATPPPSDADDDAGRDRRRRHGAGHRRAAAGGRAAAETGYETYQPPPTGPTPEDLAPPQEPPPPAPAPRRRAGRRPHRQRSRSPERHPDGAAPRAPRRRRQPAPPEPAPPAPAAGPRVPRQSFLLARAGALSAIAAVLIPAFAEDAEPVEPVRGPVAVRGGRRGDGDLDRLAARRRLARRGLAARARRAGRGRRAGAGALHGQPPRHALDAARGRRPPRCVRHAGRRRRLPAGLGAPGGRGGDSTPARSCSASPARRSPPWRCSSNYDGFSSLWLELQEGDSAEFFFEPALFVVVALVGLGLLGSRARLAGGLLLAAGLAASLHYVGLLVASAKAIGEEGGVRSAGYIGVLGGLLILAAGVLASRARR